LTDDEIRAVAVDHFADEDKAHPLSWGPDSLNEIWLKEIGIPFARAVEKAHGIGEEYTEGRDPQHVLKAEGESLDATDRGDRANASPGGGPMGVGQAAAAAPAGVDSGGVAPPQPAPTAIPPGRWKVDLPDGTYGRMPGDPPGPASVLAVFDGYVYDVEPRTGRLIPSEPPTGFRLQMFNKEMQQRASGVDSDGGKSRG
jgi:hypothetical protein